MAVKIFLPTELFRSKEDFDIYGEIQIYENNAISYFIIGWSSSSSDYISPVDNHVYNHLRHLGYIEGSATTKSRLQHQRDVPLLFAYDANTANIYLTRVNIKPVAHSMNANIFLYDMKRILQLHVSGISKYRHGSHNYESVRIEKEFDDIDMLYRLLTITKQKMLVQSEQKRTIGGLACATINVTLELINRLFMSIMEWQPVIMLLKRMVLYEHYQEWKRFRTSNKRKLNLALDKLLGICVMLMLLFIIPHPGDYLLQTSHLIIRKLRLLLNGLKGSPIGLKLNVHLNNFLLDCFNYHIDLWALFLDFIEPFVRELFVPIALLGSMGISYQMALLSDLLAVMGLHAHCFYIYTAVLYKVEIKGLQVLWKVVLGKRHNILKNRVENHNYMNRQLYLATIFFTTLFFLFPTVLVYYAVFTALRLCIYSVNIALQLKRRRLLEFPLHIFIKWITGHFFEKESIQLQHIEHVPSPLLQSVNEQMQMSVFELKVQSSSLSRALFSCESGVLQKLSMEHDETNLNGIFKRILEGRI